MKTTSRLTVASYNSKEIFSLVLQVNLIEIYTWLFFSRLETIFIVETDRVYNRHNFDVISESVSGNIFTSK